MTFRPSRMKPHTVLIVAMLSRFAIMFSYGLWGVMVGRDGSGWDTVLTFVGLIGGILSVIYMEQCYKMYYKRQAEQRTLSVEGYIEVHP